MSIKVQMAPIWAFCAPFDWGILAFGLAGPGRAPGCLCPAVTALPGNPLAPGPRVVGESVPGAGEKEAASPPSRRERRSPTADLQRQLGFPRTAQPVQNLHAYYVLARGQDLTEEGQFFLTPGEQRSGRPREVIHRCRDAYLVRTSAVSSAFGS